MGNPTNVIFLWHMHQPFYGLPGKKDYFLGWARLHAVKDYYGMAAMVSKFEKVKVGFNFSGVLLQQIHDYAVNKVSDHYADLTLKDPGHISKKDYDFILSRFFSVTFERFIRPNKRYLQLHHMRTAKKKFTPQDIRDLQAIFNLCWFSPYTVKRDKHLLSLINKGKDYTEQDKRYIIDKQYQVIAGIIPLYTKLIESGRVEVSVTPFYHPIQPLICNINCMDEFTYLKKPGVNFSYPEDCSWHLRASKDIFKRIFSREVYGSWPSEGSISPEVARLYRQEDFSWIGLNEGLLFKSLMTESVPYDVIKDQRHIIYRPYEFEGLKIFFRDRNLSDSIGFIYQGWEDPVFAAHDLMEHFKRIHYHTKEFFKDRIIPIIMDGENAWEYYKNNGIEFLETIYSSLEKSTILNLALPSEVFARTTPKKLERLGTGSWINNDFGVWIGSKENNHNWYILKRIRDLIDKNKNHKDYGRLMDYFHVIEGSDWNWWNTFDEPSGDFHYIFMSYVKEIYSILDKKIPSYITGSK